MVSLLWKCSVALFLFATLWAGYSLPVQADIVDARCDIYPRGADKPSGRYLCVLSQHHGYITIDRADGVYYDFYPMRGEPGQYRDDRNQPVYRRNGLGAKGMIFEMSDKSIYVLWDTSVLAEP
ncbi:hypothetical protein L6J37_12540 [Photobacterium sp. WH77]|uniref:hypothetical protein n=1 Tax=unclassified Photobacterium TaxID=2628852 RepID=UPI001EDA0D08|nr:MULTISPECIES: hypothetical protein [unclassified Photobacterium]MCG2837659.1 hypothetical protein [Photobacterium sp. WH77]MCG2845275.1 hypothetical protein [Photobacterium sp. WH80]MDO6582538.1 hypothetical protein [Photobacterium sp. 2_MG-2023]